MWDIFARAAFTAILAKFGQNGMTLQEIIEKDREIFNADIEKAISDEGLEGLKRKVEARNGKYFLSPGAVCQKWAESTVQNALDENIAKPYDSRTAVGNWGEAIIREAFSLVPTESKELPDYVSADGSFYVEVKTSAFDNGGIIKGRQLSKFDENIQERRFYAFAFHNIPKKVNLGKEYRTEYQLYSALALKSVYIFPFSIVKAHFTAMPKKPKGKDVYVQLDERQAEDICQGEYETWAQLDLRTLGYCRKKLHDRVKLITRGGMLEHRIADAFNPGIITTAAKSD